jgi:PPOX class probable F420-dependent enzyme
MTSTGNAEVDRLASGAYVALTTYRRDGTAVPTPVWVSSDGAKLYVWTEAGSGKVARIRHRALVLLAPCDARGRPQGSEVDASARVLDDPAEVGVVARLHRAKYGVQFSAVGFGARLFRRRIVGIELTVV